MCCKLLRSKKLIFLHVSAANPQVKGTEYTSELGFENTSGVFLVTIFSRLAAVSVTVPTLQRLHHFSKNLGF